MAILQTLRRQGSFHSFICRCVCVCVWLFESVCLYAFAPSRGDDKILKVITGVYEFAKLPVISVYPDLKQHIIKAFIFTHSLNRPAAATGGINYMQTKMYGLKKRVGWGGALALRASEWI